MMRVPIPPSKLARSLLNRSLPNVRETSPSKTKSLPAALVNDLMQLQVTLRGSVSSTFDKDYRSSTVRINREREKEKAARRHLQQRLRRQRKDKKAEMEDSHRGLKRELLFKSGMQKYILARACLRQKRYLQSMEGATDAQKCFAMHGFQSHADKADRLRKKSAERLTTEQFREAESFLSAGSFSDADRVLAEIEISKPATPSNGDSTTQRLHGLRLQIEQGLKVRREAW